MLSPGMKRIAQFTVLALIASPNLVVAGDGKNVTAPRISLEESHGVASEGGAFSVKAGTSLIGEVSSGSGMRLLGSVRLKADSVLFSDGFEGGDTSVWSVTVPVVKIPAGAIVAFELEECPAGWVDTHTSYRGRALVGLVPGGQWNSGNGSNYWTGENDWHFHGQDFTVSTNYDDGHNHHWGTLVNASFKTWQTYDASEGNVNMVRWESNGMGKEGSGFYLMTAPPGSQLYTSNASHTHQLHSNFNIGGPGIDPPPNVQLRFCMKE